MTHRGALLLLTLGLLYYSPALGKIVDLNVDVDARSVIPLTESFGYADGGQLVFTISNVKVWTQHGEDSTPDLNKFGLFLAAMSVDVEQDFAFDSTEECLLDSLQNNDLPRFSDYSIKRVKEAKVSNATFDFLIKEGGLFALYFASCDPGVPISFTMHVEMFNVDRYGNKDFLSVGQTELEMLYWIMFSFFAAVTGGWCWLVWTNRAQAQRIHYFMASLGIAKALTVMSQALMVHFIERTGYADGWNIVYYIFTFCRGILFFTVVVLIGTGWSYMKPFLGVNEKRILMVVIPLQVFANIAIIVMDEESPSVKDWFTWRDIFHLVDIICCCAILFPIVWSIKNLREASQTDGKAARSLEKLTLFRQFYIMVIVYVYFTRIIVYLLRSTLDYQYEWVSEAADQLATLAFYVWTALNFRPNEANPYLKLHETEREVEL